MPDRTLAVAFTDSYTKRLHDIELSGQPDDTVRDLLAPYSPENTHFFVFVWYDGFDGPAATPADCTLSGLLSIRDVLDTDRGRVRIDNAGRGGDPFETAKDIIEVVGTIGTLVGVTKISKDFRERLFYGRKHDAAKDWLRGGRSDVLDPLRSWVRGAHVWTEKEFRSRFGIEGADAFALLRASGYEYHHWDKTWWMINDEDLGAS